MARQLASLRDVVEIVRDLGIRKVRLITNNPDKVSAVFEGEKRGLDLVETVPLEVQPNVHNRRYLEAKRARMGHVLELRERTGT